MNNQIFPKEGKFVIIQAADTQNINFNEKFICAILEVGQTPVSELEIFSDLQSLWIPAGVQEGLIIGNADEFRSTLEQ